MNIARIVAGIVIASTMMLSNAAFAMSIPRGVQGAPDNGGFHVFQKHLAGYSNVVVDAKGRAVAWALFTSEIKLGGKQRVSVNVEVWSGAKLLWGKYFDATLKDAFLHGGHVRVRMEAKFSLTPDKWANVTRITYKFGRPISPEICDFYWEKYIEGNNLFDPQLTGCPRK